MFDEIIQQLNERITYDFPEKDTIPADKAESAEAVVSERKSSVSAGEAVEAETEQRVYTVDDIRRILHIGRNKAYQLMSENHFRSVRVGSHYRISKKSFDRWLAGKGKVNR